MDSMSAPGKDASPPDHVKARNVYSSQEIFDTSHLLAREFEALGCKIQRIEDLLYVTRRESSCYLLETETSYTSLLAFRILKNKVLARNVFQRACVNVADSYLFNKNERKLALKKLDEIGPAVIKPSDGNKGRGVSVNVTQKSFDTAWSSASNATSKKILLEKYFQNGKEARYLVVNGYCVAVHMRIPPIVYGDGIRTVSQLIDAKNKIKKANPSRKKCLIKIDEFRIEILKSQGFALDSVPIFGQRVVIDWKAGLSTGGESRDITLEVHKSMKNVAERIAKTITGLDILGVDILALDHSAKASSSNYIVVEANTRPMIAGHQFPDFGSPINVARLIAKSCIKHMGCDIPTNSDWSQKPGEEDRPDPLDRTNLSSRTGVGPRVVQIGVQKMSCVTPSGTLTLVFSGDTSLGDAYLQKGGVAEHLHRLNGSPMSFFEALTPLLSDNACSIANLETVLSEAPSGPLDNIKGYLGWDQPDRTVMTLKQVGITAVSLANNHAMDYGSEGLVETLGHLETGGIKFFGAGRNITEASQPLKLQSALGRIYILSGFEIRAKYHDVFRFYATEWRPGVNPFALKKSNELSDQIRTIRRNEPNSIIIVYPHWGGYLNYQWATKKMFDTASSFLAAGADIILGHGAHMIQQCVSNETGTTIFSLGNLVYNSLGRYKKFNAPPYSFVCRLRLGRANGAWSGAVKLYPFVSDNRQTGFKPAPVRKRQASELFDVLSFESQTQFRKHFSLERDERGWYFILTSQLSPRIAQSD